MDAFEIPATDEELLAECDVDTFHGSGPGGQSVNTADSAVRLRHRPTGVTVVCRRERSQYRNKRACLQLLRRKLQVLAYEAPERVPTTEPRRVKESVLREKARTSARKRLRKPPAPDEE
jgi:protein subunit release factor A